VRPFCETSLGYTATPIRDLLPVSKPLRELATQAAQQLALTLRPCRPSPQRVGCRSSLALALSAHNGAIVWTMSQLALRRDKDESPTMGMGFEREPQLQTTGVDSPTMGRGGSLVRSFLDTTDEDEEGITNYNTTSSHNVVTAAATSTSRRSSSGNSTTNTIATHHSLPPLTISVTGPR
jgi:hypothetical protein